MRSRMIVVLTLAYVLLLGSICPKFTFAQELSPLEPPGVHANPVHEVAFSTPRQVNVSAKSASTIRRSCVRRVAPRTRAVATRILSAGSR